MSIAYVAIVSPLASMRHIVGAQVARDSPNTGVHID
jgi:hypothetical protein